MNTVNEVQTKPWLFVYSLILPVVWMTLGVIGNFIAPGKHVGTVGTALIFLCVVTMISWLFVRKHRRHFTRSERFRIIGYCAGWAILLESCVLVYAASEGLVDPSKGSVLAFAASVAFVIDTLFLWLGFTFSSRRFINWYLETHVSIAA